MAGREPGAEGVSRNDFLQALGSLRFRGASSLFRLRTELSLCFRAPPEEDAQRGATSHSHVHAHRHLLARAGTKRSHAGYALHILVRLLSLLYSHVTYFIFILHVVNLY